ncbi:MAG TPA: AAA family ATPase [Allosphingosinicella sp.]|jgi:adenylate kinase family enzyme|uniref:AAA family ATPase n=1 Tax=Allosphingosinicella sp. TaxID=2823234 RepID=UPI002F27CC86
MQRVLVIGSPGAGKSTLAAAIAGHTGLPVIHLDQHYWRSGWVEPDKEEWAAHVAALSAGERWVMDGNYGGTLPLRLGRADTIVWLDFPVLLCLSRIVRRALRYRGRVRPDMAAGCPEQLSWEFISYTARFPWDGRKRITSKLPAFSGALIRLRTPREAERFLATLA